MSRHLFACLLLIGSLIGTSVAHAQAAVQTDAKAGVDVGNVATATRQVSPDGQTTNLGLDPTKALDSKVTLKGEVGASLPGLNAPALKKSVEKTIDLKDVFKSRKKAAKPQTRTPARPKPEPATSAPATKTTLQTESITASTPPIVSTAAALPAQTLTPKPAPKRPSGFFGAGPTSLAALAGNSLVATLAGAYLLLLPGGLSELAGHALSHLTPPQIRAEGRMGASHVGQVEFLPQDEGDGDLALPSIGVIVRPGPVTSELFFTDLPALSQAQT